MERASRVDELRKILRERYEMQMNNAERKEKIQKNLCGLASIVGLASMTVSTFLHPYDMNVHAGYYAAYLLGGFIGITGFVNYLFPPASKQWLKAYDKLEKLNSHELI